MVAHGGGALHPIGEMAMLRILFVDDEQNVLDGLRRATRSMRNEWDMAFVESGEQALEHFASNEVDVLVTDMRMPGMDGAALLHEVKCAHPGAARIILSGQSEEQAIFRSISSAHQFLAKPCDVDALRATINQIRDAQARLASQDIQEIVGGIEELPALPEVYNELLEASQQSDCTNAILGQIVSKDLGLTGEILHVVNSAFFALTRQIESIDHAIGLLGLDVIKAIVAAHGLFAEPIDGPLDLRELGEHSNETAALARIVTQRTGGTAVDAAEAYFAGMVHDIGLLVFAQMPSVDSRTLAEIIDSDDVSVERGLTGIDRYSVGSYLLGLWAFPESIVEAVANLASSPEALPPGQSWSLRLAHEIVVSRRTTLGELQELGARAPELLAELGEELKSNGSLAGALPLAS